MTAVRGWSHAWRPQNKPHSVHPIKQCRTALRDKCIPQTRYLHAPDLQQYMNPRDNTAIIFYDLTADGPSAE